MEEEASRQGQAVGSCATGVTAPQPAAGKRILLGRRQHRVLEPWLSLLSLGRKTKPQPNPDHAGAARALTWGERTVCFLQGLWGQAGSRLCSDTWT